MKKYMKRIVSWMCAVLMTLSMAVPVLATDSSADSASETENRPSGVGVSFHQGTETQIEVGNKNSFITFDLSFLNSKPGVETKPIHTVIFCFGNEMGECSFYTTLDENKGFSEVSSSNHKNIRINGARVQKNTETKIKEGTYKLKEIKLTFDNNYDETKNLPVSQDITIEVKNPLDGANRPNGIEKIDFYQNNRNNQIEVGNAESKISFDVTFTNPNPEKNAFVKMYLLSFVNDENDKCAFYGSFADYKLFSGKTGDITIPIKGMNINNRENIKEGTYKLTEIELFEYGKQPEDEKTRIPVSDDITIEVKNPLYAGDNNKDSKPTEEQIGGKYQSANITTSVSGESTATVAMTDISSQVSANLNAESKAFAEEQYNITVKSNYIPANSKVEAGKVLAGTVYNKVASLMSGVGGFRAFEINILDITTNAKVQPTGNGTVYVTVDLPTGYNKNTVAVYRINDDASTPVKLNIVTRTDSSITFETNHFSTFVIAKNAIPETNDTDNDDDNDDILVAGQNNSTTTPSNNAGTADTTNKAPKTGDMAPLAALLFVMICGGAICAVSVKKMITR